VAVTAGQQRIGNFLHEPCEHARGRIGERGVPAVPRIARVGSLDVELDRWGADDAEIRDLTQPWMKRLQAMLASAGNERRLDASCRHVRVAEKTDRPSAERPVIRRWPRGRYSFRHIGLVSRFSTQGTPR
jgi:hypothetical protein